MKSLDLIEEELGPIFLMRRMILATRGAIADGQSKRPYAVYRTEFLDMLFLTSDEGVRVFVDFPKTLSRWKDIRVLKIMMTHSKERPTDPILDEVRELLGKRFTVLLRMLLKIDASLFARWRLKRITQTYSFQTPDFLLTSKSELDPTHNSFGELIADLFGFLQSDYDFRVSRQVDYADRYRAYASLQLWNGDVCLCFEYYGRSRECNILFGFDELDMCRHSLISLLRLIDTNVDVFALPSFRSWSEILRPRIDRVLELLSERSRKDTLDKLEQVPLPGYPNGRGSHRLNNR